MRNSRRHNRLAVGQGGARPGDHRMGPRLVTSDVGGARRPHIAVYTDILGHTSSDIPHRDKHHFRCLSDAHHFPPQCQDSAFQRHTVVLSHAPCPYGGFCGNAVFKHTDVCPRHVAGIYFHPTLNPFGLPAILSVFIMAVWAILVVAIAAADVVFKELPLGEAMLYMCGLAGVCAVNYIVFSITTLYFAGYVILVAYIVFALRLYFRSSYYTCLCGNCGARMRRRGRCPECGAVNE